VRMPDFPILAGVIFAWALAVVIFTRNDRIMFFGEMPFKTIGRPRAAAIWLAAVATAILVIDAKAAQPQTPPLVTVRACFAYLPYVSSVRPLTTDFSLNQHMDVRQTLRATFVRSKSPPRFTDILLTWRRSAREARNTSVRIKQILARTTLGPFVSLGPAAGGIASVVVGPVTPLIRQSVVRCIS
jgi:hypothetical protein